MFTTVVLLVALLQQQASEPNTTGWAIPACANVRCAGSVIKDSLGVLQFCVPRFAEVHTVTGQHGDIRYTITKRRHGRAFELLIISGPYFSGSLPGWAGYCAVRYWHSPESHGEDCHISGTAGRSRYITLNAPMGYAQYRDVPAEVATQFDHILDSMCWVEWKRLHPVASRR